MSRKILLLTPLNIINYINSANLLHLKTLNLMKHLLPHQKNKMHQKLFYKKYFDPFRFLPSFHHINDTQNNDNRDNDRNKQSGVQSSPPTTTHHATTLTSAHLGIDLGSE